MKCFINCVFKGAIKECRILLEKLPNECAVYILMAKAFTMLGKKTEALVQATHALNLDSKLNPKIRDLLDSIIEDNLNDMTDEDFLMVMEDGE
jgi:hypothetical protein